MRKLLLILALIVGAFSTQSYHIPIEDHQCTGLIRVMQVEKTIEDNIPRYYVRTNSGWMEIRSASKRIEEDIYQTLLKNKNRVFGALFVAPMYYGYALDNAHSIFDITQQPYEEIDERLNPQNPNIDKEL